MQIESRRSEGASPGGDGIPGGGEAGARAAGEYRCAECGYGVTVRAVLPECPMCRGREWEEAATSSYGRSIL